MPAVDQPTVDVLSKSLAECMELDSPVSTSGWIHSEAIEAMNEGHRCPPHPQGKSIMMPWYDSKDTYAAVAAYRGWKLCRLSPATVEEAMKIAENTGCDGLDAYHDRNIQPEHLFTSTGKRPKWAK